MTHQKFMKIRQKFSHQSVTMSIYTSLSDHCKSISILAIFWRLRGNNIIWTEKAGRTEGSASAASYFAYSHRT